MEIADYARNFALLPHERGKRHKPLPMVISVAYVGGNDNRQVQHRQL